MSTKEKLMHDIEAFLVRTGMSRTRFGEDAAGERSLLKRLERGGQITIETHDRIRAFMRDWRSERPKRRADIRPAA